jgi:hypothetical protein
MARFQQKANERSATMARPSCEGGWVGGLEADKE